MTAHGDPCNIDFGRSFLRFSTTRVNHTPRLQVDAACALVGPDGERRTFYLTCPCICENMYVESGLIQEPVAEFVLVARPREEFMVLKRHADAAHDVRSPHRFNDVMPTHGGLGARLVELDVDLGRFDAVKPIRDYRSFREAMLANRPMIGRTTYRDADGKSEAILEYPMRTGNVANDREAWQVDAGPVLIPTDPRSDGLEVERFRRAFLVYNRWDKAEAAVSRCVSLTEDPAGPRTEHYNDVIQLTCRNDLFAAE